MPEIEVQLRDLAEHRAALIPPFVPPVRVERRRRPLLVVAVAAVAVVAVVAGAFALWPVDRSGPVDVVTPVPEERLGVGTPVPLPFDVQSPFVAVNGELWFALGAGGLVGYTPATGATRYVDPSPLADHWAPEPPTRFSPNALVTVGDTLWVFDGGGVQVDGLSDGPSYERYGGIVRVDSRSGTIDTVVPMPAGRGAIAIAVAGSTVWAMNSDVLVGIDTTTNEVTRTIPFPEFGAYTSFVVDEASAWLVGRRTGTIVRLDLQTGSVIGEFPLPASSAVPARSDTAHVVGVDDAGLLVLTRNPSLNLPQALSLLDPTTGATVATRELPGAPLGLARSAGLLLVANGGAIIAFEPATLRLRASHYLPGPDVIRNVAIDGDRAWLTNRPYERAGGPDVDPTSTLQRIEFSGQDARFTNRRLTVGGEVGVSFEAKGGFAIVGNELWFANGNDGLIGFDTTTGAARRVDATPLVPHFGTDPPELAPRDVLADGDTLWVVDRASVVQDPGPGVTSYQRTGGVLRVDGRSGVIEAVIPLPRSDFSSDLTLDGSTLWVVNGTALVGIDTTTNAVTSEISLPGQRVFGGLVVQGGTAWLGGGSVDELWIVDLADGTVEQVAPIARGSRDAVPAPAGADFPSTRLVGTDGDRIVQLRRDGTRGGGGSLELLARDGRSVKDRDLRSTPIDGTVTSAGIVVVARDAIALYDLRSLEERGSVRLGRKAAVRVLAIEGRRGWLSELVYPPAGDAGALRSTVRPISVS